MERAPNWRIGWRLRDELKPTAVELLVSCRAGATFPFCGRLDERHQSWTKLGARDFEFVPSVVASQSRVEVELDHSLRHQGAIGPPVKVGRRYDPDARQFHLAAIQQAKDIHEFRA